MKTDDAVSGESPMQRTCGTQHTANVGLAGKREAGELLGDALEQLEH